MKENWKTGLGVIMGGILATFVERLMMSHVCDCSQYQAAIQALAEAWVKK